MELTTLFPKSVKSLEDEILSYRRQKEHSWSMGLRKLTEKSLIQESNRHSLEIEMPQTTGSNKRHIKKCEKEALTRIDAAWSYLEAAVEEQRSNDLEEKNIIAASQILIPELKRDPVTQYRAEQVIINNATFAPPPPRFDPHLPDRLEYVAVPSQVYQMMGHLPILDGNFQKAIYAHFHIARIHPFADGNGRIARLAQNTYLKKGHLLPIVIPSNERDLYASILDAGVQQFYNDSNQNKKHSRYIQPFAEYLVSKMEDGFRKFKNKRR